MTTTLLDIQSLGRDYVSQPLFGRPHVTRALDDVSLSIGRGEIFGLVGESGCGKSTLARLVMALDRPSRGAVLFDGEDLFSLTEPSLTRKRADFQMVFQDPYGSLDPRQTVERIVAEPLHVLPVALSKSERRARVATMLGAVGLTAEHADRYPHEFSGGQRQRIAIARALITEPRLVVADEAVSALDLSVQAQVLNLLLDLRDARGITFLFITHNLAVVDSIADRVGVMYRGRLVELGPAHAVLERPLHPYSRVLAAAEPSIARAGRTAWRSRPPQPPPALVGMANSQSGEPACHFAPRCPLATARCLTERPLLRAVATARFSACHRAEELEDAPPPMRNA